MSEWINHVKNYQNQTGVSYKDAMTLARASYHPTGGKFSFNKAMKKVNKASKKVNNVANQYGHLVPQEYQQQLQQAQNIAQHTQELSGGKFNMKHALRKAGHTVNKVKSIARVAAPILSVVAPEIGLPIEAALLATGGRLAKSKNPYINGGSMLTHRGGSMVVHGGSFCPTCGNKSHIKGGSVNIRGRNKKQLLPKTYSDSLRFN